MANVYEIMHKNRVTAILSETGACEIADEQFLPYGLFLEETQNDVDTMVNNMLNFFAWCAGRVLTLDRRYAKEILSSIGASQASTDRERSKIALSCRCLTLTDVCWIRKQNETITYEDVNLYDNHLTNAFIEVSLRGKQMSVSNMDLAPDLSTSGCFPKAWVRTADGFRLFKDGEKDAVENELLASRIVQCFDLDQVVYTPDCFDGNPVSSSRIFTGHKYGICSWEHFMIFAANHDIDPYAFCLSMDPRNYYRMNIVDYLIGNTDRHWGNWGLLIDNDTNRPVKLHPLMDFNQSFRSYDDTDGARCLTHSGQSVSQKAAAVQAVKAAGLGQSAPVSDDLFGDRHKIRDMFQQRLAILLDASLDVL